MRETIKGIFPDMASSVLSQSVRLLVAVLAIASMEESARVAAFDSHKVEWDLYNTLVSDVLQCSMGKESPL